VTDPAIEALREAVSAVERSPSKATLRRVVAGVWKRVFAAELVEKIATSALVDACVMAGIAPAEATERVNAAIAKAAGKRGRK
jgi:hypothetical protein